MTISHYHSSVTLSTEMDLPLELLRQVLQYLPKKHLKQLRLACSILAQSVAPYLFDSIFLSASVADLEDATLVLKQFSHCLKTVFISPMYPGEISKTTYCSDVLGSTQYTGLVAIQDHWQEHLNLGFKSYLRHRQEALDILSTGQISRLLRQAINTAPTISKIVLTYYPRPRVITDAMLSDFCPIAACKLPRVSHKKFRVVSRLPAEGLGDGKKSVIHSIFVALSTPICNVTEVRADLLARDEHYLTPSAFNLSPRQMGQASEFLANLTKLKLSLTLASRLDGAAIRNKTVAKTLSRAVNLRCLLVEIGVPMMDFIVEDVITAFEAVLEDCAFPRLRAFILAYGDARQDQLVSFFQRNRAIEILVIQTVELKSGLWEAVIESARQILPINTVQMNMLLGGFEESSLNHGFKWMELYGDVNNFFFNNGPNPFSAREIVRYRKLRETTDIHAEQAPSRYYRDFYDGKY